MLGFVGSKFRGTDKWIETLDKSSAGICRLNPSIISCCAASTFCGRVVVVCGVQCTLARLCAGALDATKRLKKRDL
jgi:hypothetical protein